MAEAKADVDPVVCELQERVVEAKYKVARLKRHLLAWDKNHDNAMSLGHMLRKEMDKLHSTIRSSSSVYDAAVEEDFQRRQVESRDDAVDSIVGELDLDALEKNWKTNLSLGTEAMIDPKNITRYDLTDLELQELLIFCIAVFNKNADQIKYKVEKFLNWCEEQCPLDDDHFTRIRHLEQIHEEDGKPLMNDKTHHAGAKWLVNKFKFGNTTQKSNGIHGIVNSGYDLRTCSEEDLEKISGISMKTSRFFTLHTRPDVRVACLDTHILQWLREYTGLEWIPVKPPSKKKYMLCQQLFLDIADENGISAAELDLTIWNKQRGSDAQQMVGKRQIKRNLLSASRNGIWQFRNIPIYNFLEAEDKKTGEQRLLIILSLDDVDVYDIDLIDDTAHWSFEVALKGKSKVRYNKICCVGDWAVMQDDYEGLIFRYVP